MTAPNHVSIMRQQDCAALGRRWIEQQVDDALDEATVNNVKLVATELLNNAYLHGQGKIELVLSLGADGVRVEVIDEGRDAAVKIRNYDSYDDGGWGLRIVDQLSTSWGASEGTTHVWAELPRS